MYDNVDHTMNSKLSWTLFLAAVFVLAPQPVSAYVGPGAGLTAIGAALALPIITSTSGGATRGIATSMIVTNTSATESLILAAEAIDGDANGTWMGQSFKCPMSPGETTQFYIEADTIKLCPTACILVQSDPDAEIDILYGCELGGID